MVRNLSSQNQANSMGSFQKVGTLPNGRQVYQLLEPDGNVAGKITVAAQQADTFERSFQTVIDNAPKIQEYQNKLNPRDIEKKKNTAKFLKWGATLTGFLIPAIFVRPKVNKKWVETLIQVSATLGGTLAGFIAGQFGAAKVITPPGGIEVAKATQTISKLDIQPYQG